LSLPKEERAFVGTVELRRPLRRRERKRCSHSSEGKHPFALCLPSYARRPVRRACSQRSARPRAHDGRRVGRDGYGL